MKKTFYTYNAATDNFERYYPRLIDKIINAVKVFLLSLMIGAAFFVLVFFGLTSNTEEKLREENAQLRTRYKVLERRVDASMKVMENIRERDDNFYRVMMQMDPMSVSRRYAGFDYEKSYAGIRSMSDEALIGRLTQMSDLLDRQLYSQSQSFDQLREMLTKQKDKMNHVPGVLPMRQSDFSLSSGFGVRRDPVTGSRKFHEGIDLTAQLGAAVYATADGIVEVAERIGGYGNCVDITHGYNYSTRYAHLSEILVKNGQKVKRGDLIGKVGTSGKSMGTHLHYEVRFKEKAQNPVNYFFIDLNPDEYIEMARKAEDAARVMD